MENNELEKNDDKKVIYKKSDFKKLSKEIKKEKKEVKRREGPQKIKKKRFGLVGTCTLLVALLVGVVSLVTVNVKNIQTISLGHYTDTQYKRDTIRLDEVLTKQEDATYYVYIYKSDCNACNKLEKEVLKYIKSGPRPLYLLDGDKYEYSLIEFDSSGNAVSNYNVSSYTELRCPNFPCLLLIQKGEILAHTIGQSSISSQLSVR